MLIRVPKIYVFFWGWGLTSKHFTSSIPPKRTSLAENTCYEPSRIVIGPAAWPRRRTKNTKIKQEAQLLLGDRATRKHAKDS